MSFYPKPLQDAAARLVDNEDFQLCVGVYSEALKEAVFDAPDDAAALAARTEYNNLRDFVEYLKTVRTKPTERK